MTHLFLVILFGFLMLPGLAMTFVPMLPAFWYLLAVAAVFGVIEGFSYFTLHNLGILAGIVVLSALVDWSAGLLGAKFGGAAWGSLLFGIAGSLIGFVIFPPLGVFPGLFIGVLAGELSRKRNGEQAVHAATGALIGSFVGITINTMLALAFLALFLIFALN